MTARAHGGSRHVVQAQMSLWQDYMHLWQGDHRQQHAGRRVAPVIQPERGDRRFRDPAWDDNPLFDFIKQSYLLTSRWLVATVTSSTARREDPQKIDFYTRQFVDAMAPTNFVATNPEVLRRPWRPAARTCCAGSTTCSTTSAGARASCDHHDRSRRLRARQEHRGHARQGRLPERPDPADPVCADHREGLQAPAADRPALDQQVLHPRSAARRTPSSAGRSTRASRCS